MKETAYDMLYLSACAVNGIVPDTGRIAHMNLEKLFQICQFHSFTAIVCMSLESVGIANKNSLKQSQKQFVKIYCLIQNEKRFLNFWNRIKSGICR